MERASGRLAPHIIGSHLHLPRVAAQSDSDEPRLDRLTERAADSPGKIRLLFTLERNFPTNDVFVIAFELARVDHVTAGDRSISFNHASQPLLKLGHYRLHSASQTG